MAATLPVTAAAPPVMGGGFDAYATLLKGTKKSDDETRPIAKGEFANLIGKLTGEKRAQLQKAVGVFKDLAAELPKVRETLDATAAAIKARVDIEIERAARSILVALRRDEVDEKLTGALKLQLYNAYLLASDFEKAIDLYPRLKALVGGKMRGIYALSRSIREVILKSEMLEEYFKATKNSREGLLAILMEKTMTTDSPNPQILAPLYHFGSLLPLFYLLSSCADLTGGLCGNCSSTTEARIREILGDNFKAIPIGLINRLCDFASTYA